METQTERQAAPEQPVAGELTLGQILRDLYARKWLLLGATLLAGVLMAGYSLTKPNIYESTSALIIREPQVPITGEAAPMSIEVLQQLTESADVKWELFEKLWSEQALEKWRENPEDKTTAFRLFQRDIRTEVQNERGRAAGGAINVLPMLLLRAEAASPEEAQAIANAWAGIVLERSKEIYTTGVEELASFIRQVNESATSNLTQAEDALTTHTLAADLDLKKSKFEKIRTSAITLEQELLDLEDKILTNATLIRELTERTQEQEVNGEWIGSIAEQRFREGEPFEVDNASTTTLATVTNIRDLVETQRRLADYKTNSRADFITMEIEEVSGLLAQALKDKASASDELLVAEEEYSTLQERIQSIPEKVVLHKAPSDDVVWEEHLREGSASALAGTALRSEELNPLYQAVQEDMVTLEARVAMLRAKLNRATENIETYNVRLENLGKQRERTEKEIARMAAHEADLTETIGEFKTSYNADRVQLANLQIEQVKSQNERRLKREMFGSAEAASEILQEEIAKAERQEERLNREIENRQNIRNSIAERAQEVALLEITAEQSSRSGVAQLYRAEANPLKVAPARRKMVLAAMAVAAALMLLVIVTGKLVRETP